jgi:hypothetical protein
MLESSPSLAPALPKPPRIKRTRTARKSPGEAFGFASLTVCSRLRIFAACPTTGENRENKMDYEHCIRLIELFASRFPEARQDASLLGVSASSNDDGQVSLVLDVRESGCETFRERHQLPEEITGGAPQEPPISIRIKPRPILAAPSKPTRRFSPS